MILDVIDDRTLNNSATCMLFANKTRFVILSRECADANQPSELSDTAFAVTREPLPG